MKSNVVQWTLRVHSFRLSIKRHCLMTGREETWHSRVDSAEGWAHPRVSSMAVWEYSSVGRGAGALMPRAQWVALTTTDAPPRTCTTRRSCRSERAHNCLGCGAVRLRCCGAVRLRYSVASALLLWHDGAVRSLSPEPLSPRSIAHI